MNIQLKIYVLILISIPLLPEYFLFAQTADQNYLAILDSVKTFYGDTCSVGVNSKMIEKLYPFQEHLQVKEYLDKFNKIRKQINDFRKANLSTLRSEIVILLSLQRIFKSKRNWNVVNAAGIYFGADSVTNIALSYFIIKNNISKYNISLIQIGQVDPVFKKELTTNGTDWIYSKKLKQLKLATSN